MEKRNTIQKQLVMDAVSRMANHPTAEQVYMEVAHTHPTVSKATVYRNLAGLSSDGLLRRIQMPGGADRFDHRLTAHHHILCTQCGCFMDVPFAQDPALDRAAARATGYQRVTHDIIFCGVCPACTDRAQKTSTHHHVPAE